MSGCTQVESPVYPRPDTPRARTDRRQGDTRPTSENPLVVDWDPSPCPVLFPSSTPWEWRGPLRSEVPVCDCGCRGEVSSPVSSPLGGDGGMIGDGVDRDGTRSPTMDRSSGHGPVRLSSFPFPADSDSHYYPVPPAPLVRREPLQVGSSVLDRGEHEPFWSPVGVPRGCEDRPVRRDRHEESRVGEKVPGLPI